MEKIFVPKRFYPAIYRNLKTMINDLSDQQHADYYNVLNLIRFGPEDHEVYETQIKPKSFHNGQLF